MSIEHLGLFILPLLNQSTGKTGKVYEIIILVVVLKIIGKEDNAHSVKERKKKSVK